ncbi:MAG: cobalamin-binding protein [Gammaproteobacteria bacterium]|nr:cobalamin-binding protein [Gammaproteobacteria bacterium]MBQ0841144.1 cobalamin-binding protein [Gammaproteobacteria bacterium]
MLVLCLAGPVRAQISVTDSSGTALTLGQPAQRIVSLSPHLTELLFAVGAGEQIVGTVEYSDYPPVALQIPRVGAYNSISYEAIVNLAPDLVLAWQTGNGGEMIARLKALGLKVYVDEPDTLAAIEQTLEQLGRLSGRQSQAEQVAAQYRHKLLDLRRRYSQQQPLSVFYQIWNEPLLTINGEHLISEVTTLCGGRNVFATALPLVPKLSVESVIALNPQVIVASGEELQRRAWLKAWQAWPMLDAVKSKRLYFVPASVLQRHTPRILEGAEILCEQLEAARGE